MRKEKKLEYLAGDDRRNETGQKSFLFFVPLVG